MDFTIIKFYRNIKMRHTVPFVLVMLLFSTFASAQNLSSGNSIKVIPGDANGDAKVDVADISAIISNMKGKADNTASDVNGDGIVGAADISGTIGFMASTNSTIAFTSRRIFSKEDVPDISTIISNMADDANSSKSDVNGDGIVDVADITSVVSFTSTGSTDGILSYGISPLTADPVTIARGGTADLVIRMNYETTEQIAGANFNLYLPEGIILDGFNSKQEMLSASAKDLKKACNLDNDGVWGSDADASWIRVNPKTDGGLLIILIDHSDQTPFHSTNAKLLTIKLKALDIFSGGTGKLSDIGISNTSSKSLGMVDGVNIFGDCEFTVTCANSGEKKTPLTADPVTIARGGTADLVIRMNYETTEQIAGANFNLYLPEGIILDGFNSKQEMLSASAKNLIKACNLDNDGVWGSDADASWIRVNPKTDGGLLIILIDHSDQTPFHSTNAKLLTIKLKALDIFSGGTGKLSDIGISNTSSKSLGMVNGVNIFGDYEFAINEGGVVSNPVTITANSYTITYGDPLPTTFDYTVSGATLIGTPTITCTANSNSDAGVYDIIVSKGSVSNSSVTCVNGKLTIKKATLTASVGDYTKKQGDPMPSFSITYSGFKKGQNESVLTRIPTVSCNANESSAPGNYPITLSGGQATNYEFNYQNGTLTVTDADPVTITANSYTITYGDPLPTTFDYTVSGATLIGTPTITCTANSNSDAGVYDIIVSKGSVSNSSVTCVNGKLTIKKATLTASVGDYTKKQGDPMPSFSITYSGFKKGQNESVLTWIPTISCNANESSAPGNYPITLSGGLATNYEFNYQNGTLTVIAADAVSVVAKSYTITYGDPLPTFEYETSGVALNGTPSITCSANSNSDVGEYDIIVSKGSVSNYNVTYINGKLTIKKATLTASVGDYTKKQGDPMPSFSITYSGFKKGQNESVLTRIPTVSCNANESSAPGNYPITLSGGQATNYEFNYQNGTLTVIAADAVSVVAKSYTITYGDPLPKFEYETSGAALNGTPSITCSANSNSDVGEYDIIVSKGSVSNYNVTYINGKLTIKKATLTASVGNYTKKQGDPMPSFSITYSGFKKGQNESVLTIVPTISCNANESSAPGNYPITLSGGQATNYDFEYVNGVLRIGSNLIIMSIGNGTTIFKSQIIGQNSSITVTAFPDESYNLWFKPETGYKLGKLIWNDVDITNKVVNNSYKLSNVNQSSSLMAMYEEALGQFTSGGITYEILSSTENTVTVTRGNYSGHVEVPSTVSDQEGIKWRVVGIQNFAFSNTPLKTIIIPSSVIEENMGGGLFAECQELAAITWNADFAMTNNMYSGMTNPNLLFYTKSANYAPKGINNVVVNSMAEEITLTDAVSSNDFYCPKEFTAKKISYTHEYTMISGFSGEARGWESIALPFDVKEIKHATKGIAVPFAALSSTPKAKPFWLFSLAPSGFTRANSIKANTPYIISMPNNEEYDADYILSGEVTFSATEAIVKASSTINSQKSGSKTFVPSFSTKEKSDEIYVLNAVNSIHSERGGFIEGSHFVGALRNVSPFEAYMTDGSGSGRLFIDIEFSETIGIDDLKTSEATTDVDGSVYTTTGVKVDSRRLQNGTLPSGVYLRNGKKVIFK